MFDVGDSLRAGFDSAQRALLDAQTALARAAAGGDAARGNAAMAQTAQAALFQEALLAAEHARLAEMKGVAR
ncbi:MAG: hypothetical protein ABI431_00950 [Candidatus Tumulicola sp.]